MSEAAVLPEAPGSVASPQADKPMPHRRIRPHLPLLCLLAAGVVLRVLTTIAYYPAFGAFMDTARYMDSAASLQPDIIWPFGYSMLLAVLGPTGQIVSVVIVQHLLGLALAVAVYVLLVRRGVRHWLAALAVTPVLLDARQVTLEQYVLSETLFTVLLTAALIILMWRERLPVAAYAIAGILVAGAALTRTVGQVLLFILIVYLVLARVGWRRTITFGLAMAIPIGLYAGWFHHHHDKYALNSWSGRFLWARTTTFADCANPHFTDAQRLICPAAPVAERLGPDTYLWGGDPEQLTNVHPGTGNDDLYRGFALKAIVHQPGDFAKTVLTDAVHFVQPGWVGKPHTRCINDFWHLPSGPPTARGQVCGPALMVPDFRAESTGPAAATVTPLNQALWHYSRFVVTPPLALFVLALAAALATLTRRLRLPHRDRRDTLLLLAAGGALMTAALTLSAIDVRYSLPLLPLIPAAAALALRPLPPTNTPNPTRPDPTRPLPPQPDPAPPTPG